MTPSKEPAPGPITFLGALTEFAVDRSRPARTTEVLAAVLLDRSGLKVYDLRVGVTSIVVPDAKSREHVQALLRALYSPDYRDRGVASPEEVKRDFDGRTMVLVAGANPLQSKADLDLWLPEALNRRIPVVQISDGLDLGACEVWHSLVDRRATAARLNDDGVIAYVVKIVTGGSATVTDLDATVDDLKLAVRPGVTAADAVAMLTRLSDERREAARLVAEMEEEGLLDAPAAELLGVAADRVVARLSEMTGFGEARAWGLRLAEDLKAYDRGELAWADVDKGVLLSGPPGCGKSTFAKALAEECEVPLHVTSYTAWAGGKESSGDTIAKALVKLFAEWRKAAQDGPIIVFVDEMDSMGKRGTNWRSDYWYGPIVNAWLAFLDGAEPREGIVVVGATNIPDRIDDALKRPGRLERHLVLPKPGLEDLPGIIKHHLRPTVLGEGALHEAALACRGRTPADVELVCREARRMARKAGHAVGVDDLLAAVREMRGERPHPDYDWHTCVHEAGHAVIGIVTGMVVLSAEVDAIGGQHPHVDLKEPPQAFGMAKDVERAMVTLLAARAAEMVFFGGGSSTASMDLDMATRLAIDVHVRYGLGDGGLVSRAIPEGGWLPPRLEKSVRKTLDDALAKALAIVRLHRANVVRVAERLRVERHLSGDQLRGLMRSPLKALERPFVEEDDGFPDLCQAA